MTCILVTGVGGDIGYGIGKILKASGVAESVIGCDIHRYHAGSVMFDACEVIARADSSVYVDDLVRTAMKYDVDIIIPTSEPELRFFAAQGLIEKVRGISLITAGAKAMTIGFDKYRTAKFLEDAGLPFPWTRIVGSSAPDELPCILKSRFGAGGRGVVVIREGPLDAYVRDRANDIWQEYLSADDEEYTCAIYRTQTDEVRTVTFRRRLSNGITVYGEVVLHEDIEAVLQQIAAELDVRGSINVQLRMTSRGPVVFEINPRFSSTVVFRHLLGFEDVIWAVNERLGRPVTAYRQPAVGTRFYRVLDEVIVSAT